jgi:hypothetical protein
MSKQYQATLKLCPNVAASTFCELVIQDVHELRILYDKSGASDSG